MADPEFLKGADQATGDFDKDVDVYAEEMEALARRDARKAAAS